MATGTGHEPEPGSSFISQSDITGITVMTSLGGLSAAADLLFGCIIVRNLWYWRVQYQSNPKMKQCMVLILSLLTADFFTAIGAALGARWLEVNAIFAPSGWSWLQGSLIQLGTVTNAWSVIGLAWISLCTFRAKVAIPHRRFYLILGIGWAGAILTTIFAAVSNGANFYGRAAFWCWISFEFKWYRVGLNIFWVLLAGLGTIVIYIQLFASMVRELRALNALENPPEPPDRLLKAIYTVCLYAFAYLACTLPVTVGFFMELAGREVPRGFMLFAGCMLGASGFLNALVYCSTRRVLIHTNPQGTPIIRLPNRELEEDDSFSCTCQGNNIQLVPIVAPPTPPSTPPAVYRPLQSFQSQMPIERIRRTSVNLRRDTAGYQPLRDHQQIQENTGSQDSSYPALPTHKTRISDVSTTRPLIPKPPVSRGKLSGLGVGLKKTNTERAFNPDLMQIEATTHLDVFEDHDGAGSPTFQQKKPKSATNRNWYVLYFYVCFAIPATLFLVAGPRRLHE